MNHRITIAEVQHQTDTDGFSTSNEVILATVRAYREGRHGSELWKNRSTFSSATDLFILRMIPSLTVTTDMVLFCEEERFEITSVENVKGRNMYLEILAKKVDSTG